MATNNAATFSADIVAYIAEKVLPLAQRQLVAYQFGQPLKLPENRGTTYTATRYNRVPLPFAPLSEGVPPVGQSMTISQVSAVAQQWGDKITLTDVADLTIFHPVFQQATKLLAMQQSETFERNTFNSLMAGTQVNYVNSRGSRGALVAGDVLDSTTINRTVANLVTVGAPMFNGEQGEDVMRSVDDGGAKASSNPRQMSHYAAIIHPLVAADFRQNSDVRLAWTYSDLNRLYNFEIGEWGGMRFCMSNMVPSFTGIAQINPTAGTAGALATNNYFVIVTGSDTQNQYESRVYQVSASTAVVGPTGSLTVALPNVAGFTFSVYVGLTSSPGNLGLCALGPTQGPLAGQATQLAGNQNVIVTGLGIAQTPPAAPGAGLVVYPTFVFGEGAYGQVTLANVQFFYMKDAEKLDPLNQLRVAGWKAFYGSILLNQSFLARIEAVSANTATFG